MTTPFGLGLKMSASDKFQAVNWAGTAAVQDVLLVSAGELAGNSEISNAGFAESL